MAITPNTVFAPRGRTSNWSCQHSAAELIELLESSLRCRKGLLEFLREKWDSLLTTNGKDELHEKL
jgi:hypothetical protein